MPFDQKLSRSAFQKLGRQLTKLSAKTAPENVHRFRTYGRRIEALVDELVPEPTRNDKRLLKILARLRSKAGKVRDLDVQIAALRNLKIPQEPSRKSQLLLALTEERRLREKKLARAFDPDTLRELRKRLKRAAETEIPETTDPLALALLQLGKLGRDHGPLTEKILHQYRIAGKRARYLAELSGDDPQAKFLVEQLKRMQDVLGDWHDWLKLSEKAGKLFGAPQDSALVSALHNVTRAKFRQAIAALTETRIALAGKKPTAMEAQGPKPSARVATDASAVA
ncbi:MAG: CHAD domain-containing protein [Acidobacteriia bacterium]|nr:CHAD domain-containing protein [Terriglobia bacterium]